MRLPCGGSVVAALPDCDCGKCSRRCGALGSCALGDLHAASGDMGGVQGRAKPQPQLSSFLFFAASRVVCVLSLFLPAACGLLPPAGQLVGHPLNPARQAPPMRLGSGTLLPPAPGQMYAAGQHGVPLPFDQQQYGPMLPQPHQQQQQLGRFGSLQPRLGPQPGAGYQRHPQHPGAPGGAPAMQDAPVDMAAAVRAAGEEVRQLFAVGGQPLLTFVTHVPDSGSVDIVSEMARRLSSFVDALGLTGSPGAFNSSEAEAAVSMLQVLAERPASLKLLEQTGIGRTVSLLGCMHDTLAAQGQELMPAVAQELRPVQELAHQLAAMWQDLAATAHQLAKEALEGAGGGLL